MINGNNKPTLLLDIDGVLCPFGPDFYPEGFIMHSFVANKRNIKVFASEDNKRRIKALQEHFNIVWATHWKEHANEQKHLFGLVENLPTIDLTGPIGDSKTDDMWIEHTPSTYFLPEGVRTYKLPYIYNWIEESMDENKAFAWVDDSLDDDVEDWLARKSENFLIIRTKSHVGLTERQVEKLIRFSKNVSAM